MFYVLDNEGNSIEIKTIEEESSHSTLITEISPKAGEPNAIGLGSGRICQQVTGGQP